MTLFSNDYYLYVEEKNNINIKGSEWMINWKYEEENLKYSFYYKNKNNVLTLSGDYALLNKKNGSKNQLFHLLDMNIQL